MPQKSSSPESPLFHGGELARGRRKGRRPLASKRPLHLVLKARCALRAHRHEIEALSRRLATRLGLRLYSLAVASDHVHLLLYIPERRAYVGFIRALTGLLARRLGRGLWRLLPFSRVAHWGRDFAHLKAYVQKNEDEAEGKRPYEARQDWYKRQRGPAPPRSPTA